MNAPAIALTEEKTADGEGCRDHEIDLGADFRLDNGDGLADPVLRMRAHGPLGAPAIVVAGGISAARNVADCGAERGWWRDIVHPGGPIDTAKHQVFAFDFLPGDEACAKTITPADQARALGRALDRLGVNTLHAFVGASYGGFVGLAFAALFAARLERLSVISAAARPHPMATALRGVQRRILALACSAGRPREGVALARELAMTTYRTSEEFQTRFRTEALGARPGDPYDVCCYLVARGAAFAETMPAWRYLTLSDSLDRARIDPGAIGADCLFIASTSDRLVPAEDTERTARSVAGPASFLPVESRFGHDAFLCDTSLFEGALKAFLAEPNVRTGRLRHP